MLEQRSGVPRNEAHQSRTMGFLRQPILYLYLKVSSATRNNKVQLTKTEQSKE